MIQGFINKVASSFMPKATLEDKIKAQTLVSSKMLNAIKLWTEMYTDSPPWKGEKGLDTKSENIPAAIVLSCKLDAPAPCRLDAPDFSFVCHVLADCLHQHWQAI